MMFGMVIMVKPEVWLVPLTLKLSVFSAALIWKSEIVEFDSVVTLYVVPSHCPASNKLEEHMRG